MKIKSNTTNNDCNLLAISHFLHRFWLSVHPETGSCPHIPSRM